jgi:hypothetical protein
MAKATTISINNFLKTTIHPRLQDGVFWLVFIKSSSIEEFQCPGFACIDF